MTNSKTNTYRIGVLEANYKEMDKKFDRLLSNDLPHIKEEVAKIKITLDERLKALNNRIAYATIFNVGAIIVGIILSKSL